MPASLWTIAGATIVLAAGMGWAEAAVRKCQPSVSSGPFEAATELDARKGAMANWLIAAGRYSPGHTRWQLAINKSLSCTKAPSGSFRCIAVGAPCIIQQVPGEGLQRVPPVQPSPGLPFPRPAKKTLDI